MWKTGQKIFKKSEYLPDVRFVLFEGAVECSPVVLIKIEVETIEVWNAAIHMLDHFVLELQKGGVVKWDPDMAREGGSRVVAHWTETKLKFFRQSEDGVN
jgi:hypothetical protein